ALGGDLQHYLDDEAVEACPPRMGYQLRKWTSRHRTLVALLAASSLAILALAVAVVGSLYSVRLRTVLAEKENYLYLHRIILAEREWSANNVQRAEDLLDECPQKLRGWEWHYLKRQCRTELLNLSAHADVVSGI